MPNHASIYTLFEWILALIPSFVLFFFFFHVLIALRALFLISTSHLLIFSFAHLLIYHLIICSSHNLLISSFTHPTICSASLYLVFSFAHLIICSSHHLLVFLFAHFIICSSHHLLSFSLSRLLICSSHHLLISSFARLLICSFHHLLIPSFRQLLTFPSSHFSFNHLLIFSFAHLLICSSPQISYGATSVELQKDEYYGKLFTNTPSTASFNYARLAVMEHFGWKRVAILQEYDDKLYSSVSKHCFHLSFGQVLALEDIVFPLVIFCCIMKSLCFTGCKKFSIPSNFVQRHFTHRFGGIPEKQSA